MGNAVPGRPRENVSDGFELRADRFKENGSEFAEGQLHVVASRESLPPVNAPRSDRHGANGSGNLTGARVLIP